MIDYGLLMIWVEPMPSRRPWGPEIRMNPRKPISKKNLSAFIGVNLRFQFTVRQLGDCRPGAPGLRSSQRQGRPRARAAHVDEMRNKPNLPLLATSRGASDRGSRYEIRFTRYAPEPCGRNVKQSRFRLFLGWKRGCEGKTKPIRPGLGVGGEVGKSEVRRSNRETDARPEES
jgi:hypothetical protein